MKTKKLFALLLAFVMTPGTTTVFAAEDFTDVPEDAYYADAVAWAAEKGVTTGKGNGVFDPEATVSRAEAVTFLWRMAGQPEPTQTETFADVDADANNSGYKTAVQWAVEQGITNGTGNGNFSPKVTCSRGMILTMLYRLQSSPWDAAMEATVPENNEDMTLEDLGNALVQGMVQGVRSENAFADVKEGDYFELPVIWAMVNAVLDKNQIDTDAAPAAVQPDSPCPRGEMVYFLYRASGDAPVPVPEGAVETGTIPETVAFDKEGVKVTVTGIGTDEYGDARLTFNVVNDSDKTLRVGMDTCYINTFVFTPQLYIPVEDEDGFVFYSDAVVGPGETKDCYAGLSYLEDMGIDTVCELELNVALAEVEKAEDGYDYVDEFAVGDAVRIQTSLYTEGASYDMEGTVIYDQDGVKVLAVKAENDEYTGPELALYVCNSGSEDLAMQLAELKLDGKNYDGFCTINVPAGKRSVDKVYIDFDYDNIPAAKEAEITLCTLDPETWEPAQTFDPVKVTFEN